MKIEEKKLQKLTRTLLLDFAQYLMRSEIDLGSMKISELDEFCQDWIRLNVKFPEDKKNE